MNQGRGQPPGLKVSFTLCLSNDITLDGAFANYITLLRRHPDPGVEKMLQNFSSGNVHEQPVRPEIFWHNFPTISGQAYHSHLVHYSPINL